MDYILEDEVRDRGLQLSIPEGTLRRVLERYCLWSEAEGGPPAATRRLLPDGRFIARKRFPSQSLKRKDSR